ncbi:MAG: radical SAM protein, partial [Microgenomates group bacterium]
TMTLKIQIQLQKNMTRLEHIQAILEKNNQPKFRFAQIKTAIFSDGISRYSQISNIPGSLKEQIISLLGDDILSLTKVHESKGVQAHKVLFATRDGHQIESVRLTYRLKSGEHHSLCISTQSGCALGCLFCATGAIGFKKNLTADEIVDQVLYFTKNNLPVDSVIFMGMGEPLANPDNTFAAIDLMTSADGLAMSPRRLSLSTVGIVPGIARLTREQPNVNLAFSLHTPFNAEREILMPITRAYPIEKVMAAIDEHLAATNHKVFIAYILLSGVNDSARHAQALADLIKVSPNRLKLLHVNLIRYNAGDSLTVYQKPTNSTVEKFQAILTQNKIHHTLRRDFGTDIKAACGQLAATYTPTK